MDVCLIFFNRLTGWRLRRNVLYNRCCVVVDIVSWCHTVQHIITLCKKITRLRRVCPGHYFQRGKLHRWRWWQCWQSRSGWWRVWVSVSALSLRRIKRSNFSWQLCVQNMSEGPVVVAGTCGDIPTTRQIVTQGPHLVSRQPDNVHDKISLDLNLFLSHLIWKKRSINLCPSVQLYSTSWKLTRSRVS